MAEMVSEKFLCRENAVAIQDLSGTAVYLGKKNYQGPKQLPTGWAGMESTVPVFSDRKLATHARVDVTHYMGYEATQRREFLFVKNGFVLVRDETSLDDAFRAEIGPTWNTQHVGEVRGDHWINTWFSAHYSILQNQQLDLVHQKLFDVPPWDLLVWYAPRAGRAVEDHAGQSGQSAGRVGDVADAVRLGRRRGAGRELQFVTVLLPTRRLATLRAGVGHRRAGRSARAGRRSHHAGKPLRTGRAQPRGDEARPGRWRRRRVSTDGRAAYVDFDGGRLRRALVLQGTLR